MTTPASTSPLSAFLRYNTWATLQLLQFCDSLPRAQLDTKAAGAYGSIRDTFAHIVGAEVAYLGILGGSADAHRFRFDADTPLAALVPVAHAVGQALIDTAERAGPEQLVHTRWQGNAWRRKKTGYQAMALYIQIVNHGVEHRTNITTLLAQLGIDAPAVDGWGHLRDNEERFKPA